MSAGTQPGDPRRAMDVLLRVIAMDVPPLRLLLGADAIQRIRNKVNFVCAELGRWAPMGTLQD